MIGDLKNLPHSGWGKLTPSAEPISAQLGIIAECLSPFARGKESLTIA